jgi:MFS family permease
VAVRRWIDEAVGGLPRAFWFLWSGTLINRLGNFTILYLEMYLVARYHVSAGFAGVVIGLNGAGMALGALAGGVLADRWGRRPTLLLANLSSVVFTLALGATTVPVAILVLATAYGVCNGLARPAFSAMMVDVLGDRARVRGFNLNYWAINLGFAGAAILAGSLANAPRMTLFALDAVTTAASGLWIFFRVRESAPLAMPRSTSGGDGGTLTVFRDRAFVTLVLLNLGMWAVISLLSLMPVTMIHNGMSPSAFGSVIAVNGVLIVAAQLFVPRLLRGRSRTRVLAVSSVLVGIGFGAVAFAPTVLLLGLTVIVWTLGEMTASPTTSSLVADLSRPNLRGRYQGVHSLSFSVASCVAPIIGGYVIDHFGNSTVWLGGLAVGLLVACGHLVFGPARERRVAALRTAAVTPELARQL